MLSTIPFEADHRVSGRRQAPRLAVLPDDSLAQGADFANAACFRANFRVPNIGSIDMQL
ncbi:hypothetical protein [Azospirillum lipoferum]|uniref:hypothetical protein n=1 Tax=Azospirillum lipoferum TaxID=193 RepID=UPI00367360FB